MNSRASGTVAALSLALVVAVGARSTGEDRREIVGPYINALASRAVGEVEGRAYAEPRRPDLPPAPFRGVSARLLPYSGALEARLEEIKRHQRDSMATYREAHGNVAAAREAYERELSGAGAGDLIRAATSNEEGVLRLSGVPVGEWLLLAWREEAHPVKVSNAPAKDAGRFAETPPTTGFAAVSFWKVRVVVRQGETTAIGLSDRGVWLNAVREEFARPRGGAPPSAPPTRQR